MVAWAESNCFLLHILYFKRGSHLGDSRSVSVYDLRNLATPVWGVTHATEGEAGGVRMTDCCNDQQLRLVAVANQPGKPGSGTDRIGVFDTGPDRTGSGALIRPAGSNRIGYRISKACF